MRTVRFALLTLLAAGALIGLPSVLILSEDMAVFKAWYAARDWVEREGFVRATALEPLERTRSHAGPRGQCGNVQRVTVEYQYEDHRRSYTGTRFGLKDWTDCERATDWQKRWYEYLKKAKEEHQPITVYVNPLHPDESVIYREMRWDRIALDLVVWLGFAPIGMVIVYVTVGEWAAGRRRQEKASGPEEQSVVAIQGAWHWRKPAALSHEARDATAGSDGKRYWNIRRLFVGLVIVLLGILTTVSVVAPSVIDYLPYPLPASSVHVPKSFPPGAYYPEFCRFGYEKEAGAYGGHEVWGASPLSMTRAGHRVELAMADQGWRKRVDIVQSDAVWLKYENAAGTITYLFLDNTKKHKDTDCFLSWGPLWSQAPRAEE